MPTATWHSGEDDVYLRIWLGGALFDCKATATAARNPIGEWTRRRWYSIELVRTPVRDAQSATSRPAVVAGLGTRRRRGFGVEPRVRSRVVSRLAGYFFGFDDLRVLEVPLLVHHRGPDTVEAEHQFDWCLTGARDSRRALFRRSRRQEQMTRPRPWSAPNFPLADGDSPAPAAAQRPCKSE